jgi:hypothetical protein
MFLVITINHTNKQPFYPSNAFWLSDKKQELLTLREHLSSLPVFGGVRVAHLFIFLCCVFVLFVFVLCLVYSMLPLSLDCPLLISPTVFSNVYLHQDCLSSNRSCCSCHWIKLPIYIRESSNVHKSDNFK